MHSHRHRPSLVFILPYILLSFHLRPKLNSRVSTETRPNIGFVQVGSNIVLANAVGWRNGHFGDLIDVEMCSRHKQGVYVRAIDRVVVTV